jgi:acetoin utilization deacetylase AcuC-like enzyme
LKIFYSDSFDLNLPAGHRFPGTKYGMLRRRLIEERIIDESSLIPSPLASAEEIEVAHDPAYIESIASGSISPAAMRRIGFPWSAHIWNRARATMGGAVAAARAALEDGVSGQLAGGTHHAHCDFGAGYCVFNDFAIVALTLLKEARVSRIAIIDLDVHQGDGNAALLGGRGDVFVFSMHGRKNFPFRKEKSTLDVELLDGVEDEEYLAALAGHLPAVWAFRPDLILYQAGVDPLAEDRLGRIALTHRGLMARDRMVLGGAKARGVPVSIAIGGGYANPIEASVAAYANTWRVAREVFSRRALPPR